MSIKIIKERKPTIVSPDKMVAGQIGRIVTWPCITHVGTYVIKHGNDLHELDPQRAAKNHIWTNAASLSGGGFQVELVERGTVFQITVE